MFAEQAYLFRHALLRDAAYQLQLPGERARLHALALEVMELALALDGAMPDALAAELAEHARLAAEPELPQSARRRKLLAREHEYLCRAARFAQAGVNYSQAAELLRRACAYAELDAQRRVELRVELATALHQAGRVAQSAEESAALLEQAAALGNPALTGRVLHVLGLSLGDAGKAAEGREKLEKGAELLLAARDFTRAGTGLAALGAQLMNAGEGAKSRAVFERALALAQEHALPEVQRAVYPGLAVLVLRAGDSREAERMLRRSLEIAASLGAQDISRELSHLYLVYQATGRTEEARQILGEAIEIQRRTGNQRGLAISLGNLANVEGRTGNLDLADDLYARANAMHEETGNLRAKASLLARIANLHAVRGNLELALKQTIAAVKMARQTQAADFLKLALCNLGSYALDFGLLPASARCFREGIELARAATDFTFAQCASAQLSWTLILLGDYTQARKLADEANAAVGVAQHAVWRLSDVLPARVRTLCAGWIDGSQCRLDSRDVETASRAVDEMHELARMTGSAASSVELERIGRYAALVEESRAALAQGRLPLIFRGFRPAELEALTRATIKDMLAAREPQTLAALRTQHPQLLEAWEQDTRGLKPGDWRTEDIVGEA